MVPSFRFLRCVDSAIAGLEEAKNLAGKVLRLIQIRLMYVVCTETVRILSSQALPNVHVGLRLTRVAVATADCDLLRLPA
jgi:hypothetical protein